MIMKYMEYVLVEMQTIQKKIFLLQKRSETAEEDAGMSCAHRWEHEPQACLGSRSLLGQDHGGEGGN